MDKQQQQQQPTSLNYQQSAETFHHKTCVDGPRVQQKRGAFHTPPQIPPPYYLRPKSLTAMNYPSLVSLEMPEESTTNINERKNTWKFVFAFLGVLSLIIFCIVIDKRSKEICLNSKQIKNEDLFDH